MPRKGENIYKRKDGRWEGRYIASYESNGKAKYRYIYEKSYRAVKDKMILAQKENIDSISTEHPAVLVFGDILLLWLQSVKLRTKESTYAKYLQLVERHIRPVLGDYRLSDLNTQVIEQFIKQKLDSGRLDGTGGLSHKTTSDILTILKSVVEYANDHEQVILFQSKKVSIKVNHQEMRVFSLDEQERLMQYLYLDMDLYQYGVILSLYTGIRIGELCALQWKDISLSAATLKISKTMQRIQDTNDDATHKTKIIITTPKSAKSIRAIPLPVFLVELSKQFVGAPDEYVLTGSAFKFIEPRTMQNHFKTYIHECGLPKVNFHALRHSFATRCVELDFELKSLSEILGHSNVTITLNKYVHSSFALKQQNMNKLTLDLTPSTSPSCTA